MGKEKDLVNNTLEKTAEAATIAGDLLLPIAGAVFETGLHFAVRKFHHRKRREQ
jgi:hypothetical protein